MQRSRVHLTASIPIIIIQGFNELLSVLPIGDIFPEGHFEAVAGDSPQGEEVVITMATEVVEVDITGFLRDA